jgi:hypothetical protein
LGVGRAKVSGWAAGPRPARWPGVLLIGGFMRFPVWCALSLSRP